MIKSQAENQDNQSQQVDQDEDDDEENYDDIDNLKKQLTVCSSHTQCILLSLFLDKSWRLYYSIIILRFGIPEIDSGKNRPHFL